MKGHEIIIGIIYLYNTLLLYNRNKFWTQGIFRWIPALAMMLTGIFFRNIEFLNSINDSGFLAGSFIGPIIFCAIISYSKVISQRLQGRDIYLWLRNSGEVNDSKLSGGSHVSGLDRLISIILLLSCFTLPVITGIISAKS